MRGAPPLGLAGSASVSALSHGQRDAALLEALKGLLPSGAADGDGAAGVPVATPLEGAVVTAWRRFPAEPAQFADYPDAIDDRLRAALAAGGIARPYVHQAEAMAHALEGRHVVTVTPTASGKTLCYNAPVLSAILRDPATRALYLFPTKALAQDQLAELLTLTARLVEHAPIGACTYDGDTPQDARRAVRGRAHLVLSNPDMLHSGILPHHPRWATLFENLRYVVIDELHAYRGVFGSHLANILRRLGRVCAHYGSSPVFICSSATIANPRELAERLTGERFALVERNAAPRGEKFFALVNPPVVNPQLGIRRSYVAETRRLAVGFLRRRLQVIVFAQSRLITEVLTTYLKQSCRRLPGGSEAIRGYRGGYLPLRRRDIERGLRAGTVSGVVSTNALELGIDIGALEVCVMAGYPGTIAATWQRAGRAGRRSTRSAAVMVASSAPIDQFIVQHPAYFFEASPEHALINPDNLQILLGHIKCAAFELPFAPDEQFGQEDLQAVLGLLREEGFVDLVGDRWHWMHESYPADAVSLRSISSDNFVVVDVSDETTIIGEVDFSAATSTLYEQAIYLVEGKQYQVDRLDFDRRKAYARPVDSDYYNRRDYLHQGDGTRGVRSPAWCGFTWRGACRLAGGRVQEDQVLHQRERGLRRARSARAGDAHHRVLADAVPGARRQPAVCRGRPARRDRRAGVRVATGRAALVDVRPPRHRSGDSRGRGPASAPEPGRVRRGGRRGGTDCLHLRQLPGGHRVQRAIVRSG